MWLAEFLASLAEAVIFAVRGGRDRAMERSARMAGQGRKVKVRCELERTRDGSLPAEVGVLIARDDRIVWRKLLRPWSEGDDLTGGSLLDVVIRDQGKYYDERRFYFLGGVPGVSHVVADHDTYHVVAQILTRLGAGLGMATPSSSRAASPSSSPSAPAAGAWGGAPSGSRAKPDGKRQPRPGSVDDPNAWR